MYLDRGSLTGSGIVMLVLGIVFLVFPAFTLSFFAVLAGIAFLVGGISLLVTWWKSPRDTPAATAALVFGVLSIVFALVCLVHPLALASTLTWLVALLVVIAAISQLVTLIVAKGLPGRGLGIAATVLVLVFGLFALSWPPMVMQFMGISLIIEGCAALILAAVGTGSRS